MSALGQKQTFAPQKAMSALTPKADMCGATRDVRLNCIGDHGCGFDFCGRTAQAAPVAPLRTGITDLTALTYVSWSRCWHDRWGNKHCGPCWRDHESHVARDFARLKERSQVVCPLVTQGAKPGGSKTPDADVRFGSTADIAAPQHHVRFTLKSGHVRCN